MNVKPFFISLLCAAPLALQAQTADTVLKGSTIEIIQSYKPKVKQSPKPEWMPQLPPADTNHTAISYDVPQQTLYYTYNSLPLRPLELGQNLDLPPYPNYVKLGGGNLSTLYLDAGIGQFKDKDYETALHIHHMSQKGQIKYQQSALSGLEADGTLHKAGNDWHVALDAERNQYYYYGYDHSRYDYARDSVKQTYTTVRLVADMKNQADSNTEFDYHPLINASLYDARYKTSEIAVGFALPLSYRVDSNLDLGAAINGNLTHFKSDTFSTNNSFIEFRPGVNLHNTPVYGHANCGLAIGRSGTLYMLPDILASYGLPDKKISFNAGWQATLRQNTYEQLTTENPYLYSQYNLQQNIQQSKRDEVFVGTQFSVGNHITAFIRGSWWSFQSLATYVNGQSGLSKQFFVLYDNVNALSLQGSFRYQIASLWSVGANLDLYQYYNGSEKKVWGIPSSRLRADITVNPINKLTVTGYFMFMGGIHAMDNNRAAIRLNPITDIGVGAEYQIVRRLSAFAQISNMLGSKYQRWQGYEAYGFNVYGGLRFKF